MKTSIIENINTIDCLSDQISALLDLMMMSEDSVDHKSIMTASEMVFIMHDEIMEEIRKIEKKLSEEEQS